MRGGGVIGMAALALAFMLGATAASAQVADDAVKACASISKRSARLSCYDDAARGRTPEEPRAPGSAKARATAPVASAPRATTAQTFGAEQMKSSRRRGGVERVTLRATSVTDNGTGHWRIAVEGGAVWQMEQSDSDFVPPKRGQLVRIRKGAMGGYLLDVGSEASVHVTRVR